MKEDIFTVSGAMGKALATKAAGKKTVSQDSIILDLHGGVQDVVSGKSNIFNDSKRKMCDGHGFFMFPETAGLSPEEKEEKEKEHQERMMELMHMYQQYHGIIASQQYALRGSILSCQYGTNFARLDCVRDYGIHRFGLPALTVIDCKPENIHGFGSCRCPEVNYLGRLPMTVACDPQGNQAIKADCNVFPHICVPLVDGNYGWKQIDENLLVKVNAQHYAPMLTDNAVLVCQYGGIISVMEVQNENNTHLKGQFVSLDDLDAFGFFMGIDDTERNKGIENLNAVLEKYGITADKEIAFFLGQVAHESEFGARTIERFSGSDPEKYFNGLYGNRADLGNNPNSNDGELYRGAGYLHLTGRYNYEQFARYMNDKSIVKEGYKIVGGMYNKAIAQIQRDEKGVIDVGKYAWESAGWFWTVGNPKNCNLNDFVKVLDWKSVSEAINKSDPSTFGKRNQYINDFYLILTGNSLGLPIK